MELIDGNNFCISVKEEKETGFATNNNYGVPIKEEIEEENGIAAPTISVKEEESLENFLGEVVHVKHENEVHVPDEVINNYGVFIKQEIDEESVSNGAKNPRMSLMEEKPHKCPHCDYIAARACKLKLHLMSHQKRKKPRKFTHRRYQKAKKSKSNNHIIEKPYQCPHCDYKTVTIFLLKIHVKAFHADEKIYKCHICQYKTTNRHDLRKHLRASHKDNKFFRCYHCNFITERKVYLKKHIIFRHICDKPPRYPQRDRTVRKSNTLQTPNLKSKKYRQCPYCSYNTGEPIHLKAHIMNCHASERSFPCSLCPYKAIKAHDLKKHIIAQHTGEKPHKCAYCDYKTAQSSRLKTHIMARHTHTGEKPHKCTYCDYKTAQSNRLKTHIMTRHTFVTMRNERSLKYAHVNHKTKKVSSLKTHNMVSHFRQSPQVDYATTDLFKMNGMSHIYKNKKPQQISEPIHLKTHITTACLPDKSPRLCAHFHHKTVTISSSKTYIIARHIPERPH